MINYHCSSFMPGYRYQVNTKEGKVDGQPLKADDYLELGYMAGRFGTNICTRPVGLSSMKKNEEGVMIDIDERASVLFENKLDKEGIRFNRIA